MFPYWLRGAVPDFDTISLLHTTDLHGNVIPTATYDGVTDVGGLARCATRLRQWKAQNPHCLIVDAGDLYQGTQLGYGTQGQVMIDCLNHLDYDAWVVGNHEFDWGVEALEEAVRTSTMPVLSANASIGGTLPGQIDKNQSFGNLFPYLLREVNGYKIALLGLTTPNLDNWFLPELLGDYEALDPAETARASVDRILLEQPDAIIAVTHMGIRPWSAADDAANRLQSVMAACPEIDGIIGGHTHQNMVNKRVGRAVYTQANYFGIHVGRLDLVFDRNSRRLIHLQPMTSYMDSTVDLDPEVIALTAGRVQEAEAELDQPIGVLEENLSIKSAPGKPSDLEKLIGAAILEGLRKRDYPVDGVIHGLLFQDEPHPAGEKTVRDMWSIIPFENFTVLADLTREELYAVTQEVSATRNHRSLLGLSAEVEGRGENLKVKAIRDAEGREIGDDRRFSIAFNSYDAAGGGARFPLLRELARPSSANRRFLRYQTRALLVEFFQNRETVGLDDLQVAALNRRPPFV